MFKADVAAKQLVEMRKNLGESCPADLLQSSFFVRLEELRRFLCCFHRISKSSQERGVPTGSSVIKWTSKLFALCEPSDADSSHVAELKEGFTTCLSRLPYLTAVSNYLKAACLDTRYAGKLVSEYNVPQTAVDEAWNCIIEESLPLFPTHERYAEQIKSNLQMIRHALESSTEPDPLKFWRSQENGGVQHDDFLAVVVLQMRRVAAMYLSFPSGESFSETSFSYTGRVVSKGRETLEDENLENMLLVRAYTQQPYYSFDRVIGLLEKMIDEHVFLSSQ